MLLTISILILQKQQSPKDTISGKGRKIDFRITTKNKLLMTYNQGYTAKQHSVPVKRYCQTLNLKNNPALIAEYRKIHSKKKHGLK